ncbi:hypothetical protein BKE30_00765 [Alkanindiges hydrocarboniclasticus]|uniref:Cell division protein ZipA n=1 Tax=Alkanindiges hydrocarboniclasticus TaxID=1907941 RepID=A0A1S8D014_9GAMM|nr:cell division protein ZipA C-terminal FtsZ-binding domain-containing protein [Alkanindiges hydrocarboniclasticus]ONG42073.1 hypothetical protein BKE30_00765 [Alkanindiges hydrocarboniclasticus]
MDFLTIVGYVIAALAIALGLYLMLRKNAANENTTTASEQLLLDENDSNPDNDHNGGRIPVVPRHVRDQIRQPESAAQVAPAVSPTRSTAPQPASPPAVNTASPDDDLLAEAPAIKADRTTDSLADALNDDHADAIHNAPETISSQQTQSQVQALAESSKPDQDPVEDTFDQALAQLEAATSADDTILDENTGSAQQADTLATADVEEWQGESALLDAHLEDQERRDDESALAQAEHIVALYVMPNASRTLSGERTIQLLRQFGLRYGEMSLFHRFADSDGTGPLMFSVLRYTSEGPSGFDLETLPTEQVEGLAFFLALPSKHAVAGYDTMVSISTLLAREIHGQVYDEHMNQLSPQLREHYRHFVLEYRTPA